MQPGNNRSRQGHFFFEHRCLVNQDVSATSGEALVVNHVALRHSRSHSWSGWHGLGRIACVFIVSAVASGWLFENELAPVMQVECPAYNVLGWPAVKLAPLVGSGLENVRLGQILFS